MALEGRRNPGSSLTGGRSSCGHHTIIKMDFERAMDVVGVGLNATDTLIQVAEFPKRGSKVEYDAEAVQPGGQVASAMVACQLWGLRTRYVGKLGDDDAANLHERAFEEVGVETRMHRVPGAASPRSLILVDGQGERTVLGRRDERVILKPEDLKQEWIVDARSLLVDGHDTAAAITAARWAREAGVPVVADIDECYPDVETLIELVDYLIASRDFPTKLTGESDLRLALRMVERRYGCRLTAATLGVEGVLAWNGQRFYRSAAYQVPVVDTTGAGDIFHAGFLFGMLAGWDLNSQLDFACAAAAMNCKAQGARGGLASVQAIKQLMRDGLRYEADEQFSDSKEISVEPGTF